MSTWTSAPKGAALRRGRAPVRPAGKPSRRAGAALARLQRGQATLEILVVLFILIPLIFGGIELSRAVAVRAALDSGVGVAVRALSLDRGQWGWALGVINDTVIQNIFGSVGVELPVSVWPTAVGSDEAIDLDTLNFGDSFCLIGQTYFTPDIPFITNTRIRIRVRHCGIVEELS